MREYGVIHTAFWTDDKIASLSTPATLLGAYLLSCPHSNAIGCFRLPMGYVSEDLGWSPDMVHEALGELAAIKFICRDESSGWTFIRKFLEFNTIENPNVGKACMRMIDAIPAAFPFFDLLISALEPYEKRFPAGYLDGLRARIAKCRANGSANGSGNGSGNRSANGSRNPFENRMPNPEPEPEPEPSSVASATAPVPALGAGLVDAVSEAEPTPAALAWGPGLDSLAQLTGRKADGLRRTVGGWCRDYGEAAVVEAISDAVMRQPPLVSPIPWIIEALKARKADGYGKRSRDDRNAALYEPLARAARKRVEARSSGDGGGAEPPSGRYH